LQNNTLDKEYMSFLVEIKTQISNSQYRAVTKVNQELLFLYWNIGKLIIQLQEKTAWGDNFLEQLARDIKKEFPTTQGYSYRNLKYMRAFARICIWADTICPNYLVA
jgi:predicted nuclease of restriction endonuclease-like (RecB) superfamily